MMTMSSQLQNDNGVIRPPRFKDSMTQKSSGATYTPEFFADFVATQIVGAAKLPTNGIIRVLDPAMGEGALLKALIKQLPESCHSRLEVVGFDTNADAVLTASNCLVQEFPLVNFKLETRDFLEYVMNSAVECDLFSEPRSLTFFDLIIANPPYVRTQIIGSEQAQMFAQQFGLTGRVDLYYPFLLAISQVLAEQGVTGVITSNRFMTTKSGQTVRRALLKKFRIIHSWDLGDTRLFDAAVLPAVLLAGGTTSLEAPNTSTIKYSSLYQTQDASIFEASDVLSALVAKDDTVVSIPDGRKFRVRHGTLENGGDAEGVWRIATRTTDKWLATVEANTSATFRQIGKIRVGVKSTADKIFVRSDWDSLPGGRPELLRPLITRHCARRFKGVVPAEARHLKEILYPHETTATGRKAVDLVHFPKAAKYLEGFRRTLEARTYVIEAGRQWYELWVPQDPAAWEAPKLVFPDISEKPIFWIDTHGAVVNGECYWLKCEQSVDRDMLWLALAVANSTFIEIFYDHRFNNKLYAGRRRFITQYVEQFPLPDIKKSNSRAMVELVKRIHDLAPSVAADNLALELDLMVWKAFGLDRKKVAG
jgi:adenine-specific DNA-methyltransferase